MTAALPEYLILYNDWEKEDFSILLKEGTPETHKIRDIAHNFCLSLREACYNELGLWGPTSTSKKTREVNSQKAYDAATSLVRILAHNDNLNENHVKLINTAIHLYQRTVTAIESLPPPHQLSRPRASR